MSLKLKNLLIVFTVCFVSTVSIIYVNLEQDLYSYDYRGYWARWEEFCTLWIEKGILTALYKCLITMQWSDYNMFPTLFISEFYFFSPSRLSYILGISIVYITPCILLSQYLLKKIYSNNCFVDLIYLFMPLTWIGFWHPTLRGYLDCSGLIFIILSLILCINNNFTNKFQFKKSILLGILLWLPFLFRRWYIYTIITLYITLPIFTYFFHNKLAFEKQKLINVIKSFFIAGLSSLFFSLTFQFNLILKVIKTSYKEIYAIYNGGFYNGFISSCNNIGIIFIILAGISIICSTFLIKDKKIKIFIYFCLITFCLSFCFFNLTQNPGIHHTIPFSFWILMCVAIFLNYIFSKTKYKVILTIITIILLFFNQWYCLIGAKTYNLSFLPTPALPLKLENYPEYIRLANDLEKHRKDINADKVAIFSSSLLLNDSQIHTANKNLSRYIINISHVDARDKIKIDQYSAQLIVIADPIQSHGGQQVGIIPAKLILQKEGIGRAYEAYSEVYTLAKGIKAKIYRKTRAFTQEEVKDFFNRFYIYYPEWRSIYDNPEIIKSMLSNL